MLGNPGWFWPILGQCCVAASPPIGCRSRARSGVDGPSEEGISARYPPPPPPLKSSIRPSGSVVFPITTRRIDIFLRWVIISQHLGCCVTQQSTLSPRCLDWLIIISSGNNNWKSATFPSESAIIASRSLTHRIHPGKRRSPFSAGVTPGVTPGATPLYPPPTSFPPPPLTASIHPIRIESIGAVSMPVASSDATLRNIFKENSIKINGHSLIYLVEV